MNITFTGYNLSHTMIAKNAEDVNIIAMMLKLDDKGTKDLSDFKQIFKKFPSQDSGDDVLQLNYYKNGGLYNYEINDKPVGIDNENLPHFQKIMTFLRRVFDEGKNKPDLTPQEREKIEASLLFVKMIKKTIADYLGVNVSDIKAKPKV